MLELNREPTPTAPAHFAPVHFPPVHRGRAVVVALGGGELRSAQRVATLLAEAGIGSGQALTVAPGGSGLSTTASPGSTASLVVIPPIERWLGLTPNMPVVKWAGAIVESAGAVVAIGSGVFLLAACGQLDQRRVAVASMYSRELSLFAPDAVVLHDTEWWHDGPVTTAVDAGAAIAACRSLAPPRCSSSKPLPSARASTRRRVSARL